ncbi:MAG: CRISPR-associated protein Csx15 [Candidatus Promineifilaceae bacterium]
MILLNFAHPLNENQLAAIEQLIDGKIDRVVEIRSQIDAQQPLGPQITKMADTAGLTAEQWQSEALLVNPPSLNYSAVVLMAELHGRMGYFPACIRLRPVPESIPPRFEVAEIMNLQTIRSAARQNR